MVYDADMRQADIEPAVGRRTDQRLKKERNNARKSSRSPLWLLVCEGDVNRTRCCVEMSRELESLNTDDHERSARHEIETPKEGCVAPE